ncbi:hypothetical protein QEL91_004131 [Pseudomonas putida]|nr:hypothetical protein [Pseudomonas putida]
MKPRIEKKLSKKLVAIFEGTRQFDSVWIDNEYCRDTHYSYRGEPALTPAQVRHNRESRVSVNHVPSVGGEADYWGEGTDYFTVRAAYEREVADGIWYEDELFRLTHRYPDDPGLSIQEQARKAFLLARAKRLTRHRRKGLHMLALARAEAAVMRFKEAIQARDLAASRARWAVERKASTAPNAEHSN